MYLHNVDSYSDKIFTTKLGDGGEEREGEGNIEFTFPCIHPYICLSVDLLILVDKSRILCALYTQILGVFF